MKKILKVFLIITILSPLIQLNNGVYGAETEETYFIVTAYYSPLPNQKNYLKGDYEAEKRLNGQGIAGASGKKVFSGMLAAPKSYSFGTKIYLEGLGIGEVSDRGGAIVQAGKRGYEHDRIDVWMGYGDEGLRRALYWGKRKVKGYIVSNASELNLDYNSIPAPTWATKNLKSVPNIFNKGIGVNSDKDLVKKLQEFLVKVGMYNGELDGIYNSKIIDLIYDFQIENNIIKDHNSYGAGYWGTKTRNLVLQKYLNGDFDNIDETSEKQTVANRKENDLEIFETSVSTPEQIKTLQKVLKDMGLYDGEITGVYKDIVDIITDYQLDKEIIAKIGDTGTGYYGPKTRSSLKANYKTYVEEKQKQEKLKRQEEERKAKLEEKFKALEELSKKEASSKIENIGEPIIGEISQRVRELQKTLKQIGFFSHKDTAIFGEITKKAILAYQIDRGLIKGENDLGAGIYGPKTKQSLINDLSKIILEDKISKDNELAEYKNNIIKQEEVADAYIVGDTLRF